MQKIFSQKLRFKDENGNEYPEWQLKNLNELGRLLRDYRVKLKMILAMEMDYLLLI